MERIASFSVDHSLLVPGLYLSRRDREITSLDLRFKKPNTGDLLTNTLPYRPFLIKPNLSELEELFGETLTTQDDICRCAKELQQRGAKNVLVSLGGDGALLVCEDGQVLSQPAPEGKVINTTGAGDSMIAGFLAGFAESKNLTHALQLGICAGSASAFSENLATKNEIRILERGILHKK